MIELVEISTGSITDGTSNTVTFGENAAPTPSVSTGAKGGAVSSRPPATATSSIKDGTSNTISIGTRPEVPARQTVCVSDVFVRDPQIEVRVNVAGRQGQGDTDSRTSF